MKISDIRYLIADLFHGQLGSYTDKNNCSVIQRLTPTDNEQSALVLQSIQNIPGLSYFQSYGLDNEDSQTVLLFGGSTDFARQVLEKLKEIGFDVLNYSSEIMI